MPHLLRLSDVSTHLVGPVKLSINPGELVILSGPSGCGKSLLLRAIADLDDHQGDIQLENKQQSSIPVTEWRSRVGYLPEESHWWSSKVGDHFSSAPVDLLTQLGFEKECLNWSVNRLSSGERQRLGFARLLSVKPQILLLDEPTANLDQNNTNVIEEIVQNYIKANYAAALWVTHDPQQLKQLGNRRYHMEKGKLATWT